MNKYKNDIESFMDKDDLGGLIRYLGVLPELDNKDREKLMFFRGQLSKLESDRSLGVLSQENYSIELNKIRYGLLQFTAKIENKVEEKEIKEKRRKRFFSILRKYGLYLFIALIGFFAMSVLYKNLKYRSSINLPRGFISKKVDKKSVENLYDEMQKDSTLGIEGFNEYINVAYSLIRDKKHYLIINDLDSSFYSPRIVSNKKFVEVRNNFFSSLEENEMTFGELFKEMEYIKELEENILFDSIQNIYRVIDNRCIEVQEAINEKLANAEKIKKNVTVSLENKKVNRKEGRFQCNPRVSNGLENPIYSVKTRQHAIDYMTRDTITSLISQIDNSSGIYSVYTNRDMISYWNQPHIYGVLKEKKSSEYFFSDEILEVNYNGEIYSFFNGKYSPENLPYNSRYNQFYTHTSPSILTGYCFYLSGSDRFIKENKEKVEKLIWGQLESKGFVATKKIEIIGDLFKED